MTTRNIIALLAGERAALRHAEARYKANRRAGFIAHNKQVHCEDLSRRNKRDGHPKLAERQLDRARTLSHHAYRDHLRAQHWFAETRRIAHRIHRLENQLHKIDRDAVHTMFDTVDLSQMPKNAPAVGGYTGGMWPTYHTLVKEWPHAKHLSIAISAAEEARCLDIEAGDATPYQAPVWMKRELAKQPHEKPVGYGSVSAWPQIRSLLDGAGIHRGEYLVFTAHYSNQPHICGPHTCGELPFDADLTQFTPAALGRNLDESRLTAAVFA